MNDDDIKLAFIEKRKKLFQNILRQLEYALTRNATTEEFVNEFKSCYKKFVYDEAKKEYTDYRLRTIKKKEKAYEDDLFSSKI